MKEKERDSWDEAVRNKLYNFEADTTPEDWAAIAGRLSVGRSLPFRMAWRYIAAAAVVSLLVITGGYYLYDREAVLPLARQVEQQTEKLLVPVHPVEAPIVAVVPAVTSPEEIKPMLVTTKPKPALLAQRTHSVRTARAVAAANVPVVAAITEDTPQSETVATPVTKTMEYTDTTADTTVATPQPSIQPSSSRSLIADAAPVGRKKAETPSRKWGIGMGAGGLSAGTDNSVNAFVFRNTQLKDDKLMTMNGAAFNSEVPKTDIHHRTPVSFGLSVGRYLNSRFSLQTGLSYTFLSSDWTTNGANYAETKQKLHYLGIPLALSYKIAEWNRMQFYAAAGAMAEVNVAGKLETKIFTDGKEITRQREPLRMQEWLWSVNGRVGVSYPIIRFVSAFAEVGAGYYFDNGSPIETIRSEKPFNVNLQLGFRLGF